MEVFQYDAALITLENRLNYNQFVQPVCLPSMDAKVPTGTKLMVSGFGLRSEGATRLSRQLQYVELPTVDHETCARLYERIDHVVTDDMMCAGYSTGGKDSCSSDSGGPLVQISKGKRGNDQAVLTGIVSWAKGCAWADFPGVNVNVTRIFYWIRDSRHKVERPYSFKGVNVIEFQNSKCRDYLQLEPKSKTPSSSSSPSYISTRDGTKYNAANHFMRSPILLLLIPLLTLVFVV